MRVQLKESIKVDNLILPRRAFLKGLLALVAAPAVVRAESLMPIVAWRPTFWYSHGGGMNFLACSKADPRRRRSRHTRTAAGLGRRLQVELDAALGLLEPSAGKPAARQGAGA
jgi:hypothetical protein